MASAWIQSAAFNAGSPMAFSSNITNGSNLYAVIRRGGGSSQPTALTDTLGNTWTKLATEISPGSGDHTLAIWQALNSPSGANSVSETGGSGSDRVVLIEISGLDTSSPVDIITSATGSSTSPTVTTGTLAQTNNFILGGASDVTGAATISAGSGYSNLTKIDEKIAFEGKNVTSTSAVTVDFSLSSSDGWGIWAVVLKDASGSSPQSINAGGNTITLTDPTASVSAGNANVNAGGNVITLSAPVATISPTISLNAGGNQVTLTNPTASVTVGAISINAGGNVINFTNPLVTISGGAVTDTFWNGNTGNSAMTGGGDIEELD